MDTMVGATLLLNMLWFGAGFWQFTLKSRTAALGLVSFAPRDPAYREIVAGSLRFLGGLNLAFAALAAMTLIRRDAFDTPASLAIGLLAFAIAHSTQFLVNLPIARAERTGGAPLWPVLGAATMRSVFAVDLVLTLLNGGLAVVLLTWS